MADNDKTAARAAEDRRNAIADRNAAIDQKVREGREAMMERNAPLLAQESGVVKPTPTPEEIDAAVLGRHVANKEDDGSGPDPHLHRSAADIATRADAAPYMTREAKADPRREASNPAQTSSTSDAGGGNPGASTTSQQAPASSQTAKDSDKSKK